ncbi:DUF294 nucleotidyltransferase-like domain-containing protein [Phaeodactylibacter luteus]|uniref:CBS domain-containing protein n=1 Tax=Phaeodactylibacter luteus TaxID=1564516 RepID=A0A5C6RTA5_9BACT|nr:DUF294 nucleotidyltransferase-like domain-containing protein [Phaeodactylibacter luteus]TXB64890.1 CBS domain-containing protein [Phaeodactylibacter luteus]
MDNLIPRRVYDFLKQYPPFSLLSEDVLLPIAEQAAVRYVRPGEELFRQGEQPGQSVFIVREGAIQLFRESPSGPLLVEQCDEGDVFGIRPLLASEPYALTARAGEESLVYAVKVDGVRQILDAHPGVALYLAQTYAAGVGRRYSVDLKPQLFLGGQPAWGTADALLEVQPLEKSKAPVTCAPGTTIQQAAEVMSAEEVGSIIVVSPERHPLGIVTDKDLRKKIATGQVPLARPVEEIMSSPVVTVPAEVTMADAQIAMVRHRIHHLCLTEDGTTGSPVVGVLSEHDLMVMQGNNPAILIRETRRCKTSGELREIRERAEQLLEKYIYQEVAISFISTVMTEINDAIIARCLELAEAALEEGGQEAPAAGYCWLALGSEGRGEQLLRTDQDNALVFENVPEEDHEKVKAYYLELARLTTTALNEVGFDYCPGEMMASNPKWCLSLAEWEQQFSHWIFKPEPKAVMYCTIFFDFRPVYGMRHLGEALTAHIFEALDNQEIFMAFLAKNALQNPPPLTFFRNFVVEGSGEHKNEFDIKARAMMPLADAARVLALHARVPHINNTFRRFDHIASLEQNNRELYEQAADAYEILMRYRALQGLRQRSSGRFFNPADLSKMERINLRNAFRPIKELQSLLTTRFQLNLMG